MTKILYFELVVELPRSLQPLYLILMKVPYRTIKLHQVNKSIIQPDSQSYIIATSPTITIGVQRLPFKMKPTKYPISRLFNKCRPYT